MLHKTVTINGVNFSLLTGKKAEALVEDYRYAERKGYTWLRDVYGRCSYAKERAFDDCDEIRRRVGGGIMYIASYNIMMFTLVYLLRHEGHEYIVKETPSYRFIAEVNFGALR